MAKSRKSKYKVIIGAQRLSDVEDGKEKRPEEMTQPMGHETNRMRSRFSEGTKMSFRSFELSEDYNSLVSAAKEAGSPWPEMTAAIASLESNYGKSSMAKRANNLFGQTITKKQIGSDGITGATKGADGQDHAVYDSPASSVKHHAKRWGQHYVKDDPDSTLKNLVKAGYNTVDPKWSGSIKSIYNKYNKTGNQANKSDTVAEPKKSTASVEVPKAPKVVKTSMTQTTPAPAEKKLTTRQRFNQAFAAAKKDPNIGKGGVFDFEGKKYKVEHVEEALKDRRFAKNKKPVKTPSWRKPLDQWQDRVNKAVDAMTQPTEKKEQVEYDKFGHEISHPKSAKETLTKRFKLGRAKHTPHPSPIQGGEYRQTPQMERPHYEETDMKTLSKFMNKTSPVVNEARDEDDEDKGGAKKHIIAQMRKVISMRGEHHVEFKDGKKVKLTPAIAHKALEMHDNMRRPSDKEEFTHHIGQSVEHLKSGLKGNWKQEAKPKITLAGPKLKKEEVDYSGDVAGTPAGKKLPPPTVKMTPSPAGPVKFPKKIPLPPMRDRKMATDADIDAIKKDLTKEAKDDREYGYEGEMATSQIKAIMNHSKQLLGMLKPDTDLPEWVQSKITLAADYIQTAADYMSTQMNEEAHKYTVEEIDSFYNGLSDEHKAIFEKMDRAQIEKMISAYHAKGGKITKGKTRAQKETEKPFPASKMKGSKWASTARSVTLKNQGYKG